MSVRTYDPVWDDIYGQGAALNRYPYDFVVSAIYRHAPRDRPRREVRILEVGCGAANNLWFAAREGFSVAGIDGSEAAIEFAKKRFSDEGLAGDLRVGDMTKLPFGDAAFDFAIDRCAITCLPHSAAREAVGEVRRVLRTGGLFLMNPYSTRATSFSESSPGDDGLRKDIRGGTLTGVGELSFYSREILDSFFATGWAMLNIEHLESVSGPPECIHAEWRVLVRKSGS